MLQKFKNNKAISITIITSVVICILIALYCLFAPQKEKVPLYPVQSVTVESVKEVQQKAGVFKSDADVKTVVKEIEVIKEKPAQIQYVTYTEAAADAKAEELAAEVKADYVIKETKPAADNQPINNNFYAITTEKHNRISIGAAYIDNEYYMTAAYQHDRLRIEAYKSIQHKHSKLDGVGISYDVITW